MLPKSQVCSFLRSSRQDFRKGPKEKCMLKKKRKTKQITLLKIILKCAGTGSLTFRKSLVSWVFLGNIGGIQGNPRSELPSGATAYPTASSRDTAFPEVPFHTSEDRRRNTGCTMLHACFTSSGNTVVSLYFDVQGCAMCFVSV